MLVLEWVLWALLWPQVLGMPHKHYAELKFGGLRLENHKHARDQNEIHVRQSLSAQYSEDPETWDTYMPPGPGNVYKNTGFVTANGTSLTLNGKPWQFSGTNAFYAGLEYIMSEDEVRHMMLEQEKVGTSVMRLFVSSLDGVPNSMMPEFGVVSESALRRLDLLLLEAAKRNIRVIVVLANYWNFLGGMQRWVDAAYPNEQRPLETFYTDDFLRAQYKWFAGQILNRRNSHTGVLYKEDPTIFSFELANEPRTSHGYDRSVGRAPGATICDWVAEMSAFVRALDSNHLLTVGDEGMRADVRSSQSHGWLNDGHEGVDWLCNLQYADVATIHLYPDSWGFGPGEFSWLGPYFLKDRRDIAWAQNKPVILEEFGMRRGYLASRSQLFGWALDQVTALGYAGSLVWAASHEPREGYQYGYYGYNDGQGYVFGLSGMDTDGASAIVDHNRYVRSLVEPEKPCTDVPPDSSYTCRQQSDWGKCAESGGFMSSGTCDWSCARCGAGGSRANVTVVGGDAGASRDSALLSELVPAEDGPAGDATDSSSSIASSLATFTVAALSSLFIQ